MKYKQEDLSDYSRGFTDGNINGYTMATQDLRDLIKAVKHTLEENLHLCDGDVCTLGELRNAYNDLPETVKKIGIFNA